MYGVRHIIRAGRATPGALGPRVPPLVRLPQLTVITLPEKPNGIYAWGCVGGGPVLAATIRWDEVYRF